MYVIVRDDLSAAQKAVQLGHAALELVITKPEEIQNWNKTLVYLVSKDIEYTRKKMKALGINVASFYEPDIDNQLTAIACVGQNDVTKRLRLLV